LLVSLHKHVSSCIPLRNNPEGDKSHDLNGYLTSQVMEVNLSQNSNFNKSIVSVDVWHIESSCW